ncbi:uncharacterized protein LOC144124835 [Amblyomma americanum]
MSWCCVPKCRSDEKKKPPGLSFHEIPVHADLRVKWLAAIPRDNWIPNTTSAYTKVCSRHFKTDDFLEGKTRRLKKGVVPSIFENYPSNSQPKATAKRRTESAAKRLCVRDKTPSSSRVTCLATSRHRKSAASTPSDAEAEEPEPMLELVETAGAVDGSADQYPLESKKLTPSDAEAEKPEPMLEPWVELVETAGALDGSVDQHPLESAAPTPSDAEAEEPEPMLEFMGTAAAVDDSADQHPLDLRHQDGSVQKTDRPRTCDKAVQIDSVSALFLLATEKARWRRKERDLESQILKLQLAVTMYETQLRKLREDRLRTVSFTSEKEPQKNTL